MFFKKSELMGGWPEKFDLAFLQAQAGQDDDLNFKRLCAEYLPLKFSRRHGDPSRPWNRFSINLRDEETGSKILDYQGNWRDIFQNWEALVHSYPEFIEGMIFKFLNATTFDGYNPYRVFKDGFEWEEIEPDNPGRTSATGATTKSSTSSSSSNSCGPTTPRSWRRTSKTIVCLRERSLPHQALRIAAGGSKEHD